MISWLKQVVWWLEVRFPEKVVVTAVGYRALQLAIDHQEATIMNLLAESNDVVARLAKVEAAAVHKDAVRDLISVVTALKDEVTAIKANLGWQKPVDSNPELSAMLNGELI